MAFSSVWVFVVVVVCGTSNTALCMEESKGKLPGVSFLLPP